MITQQQALEALDELEGSARGDEPFNHFAAPLLRQYIEQGAQPGADVVLRELVEANREPLWLHATNSRPRDGQSFEDWQAEQAEDQAHRARRTARLEAAWVAAYNLVPAAPQPQQEQSK